MNIEGLEKSNSNGVKGKKIISYLFFIFIGFLLTNVVATQYFALQFNYHPALGNPIAGKFYLPFNWVQWVIKYSNQYQDISRNTIKIVIISMVVMLVLVLIFNLLAGRKSVPVKDLHGSAHWANADEVEKSNLLDNSDGVYIGGWQDKKGKIHYLRHNGPEHVLAFAPTRSGKGVGLVIPTLLGWVHSAVILDNKGENYALTAGWREHHANNVIQRFDPTASGTDKKYGDHRAFFNPLAEVDPNSERLYGDVLNIVEILAAPTNPNAKGDAHFDETAKAFLVGFLMHCIKTSEGETTLGAATLKLSDSPFEEIIEEMVNSDDANVRMSGQDMKDREDKERSGVLSTAKRFLQLFRDPVIAYNTSKSTFKVRDLMNKENAYSLFMVIQQKDKERIKPLIRIMITQILLGLLPELEFEKGQGKKSYRHRLLMLMDEFPTLGYLGIFEESIAYLAGYGIKCYLIVQDLTQLMKAYTRDESIVSNCHIRIAYAPNKIETAELLSKMSGVSTVIKKSIQTSGKRSGFFLNQVSESWQEVQRPLLTADEAMTLPAPTKVKDKHGNEKITAPGQMLIFIAGQYPIKGVQTLFFQDKTFLARAQVSPKGTLDNDTNALVKAADANSEAAFANEADQIDAESVDLEIEDDVEETPKENRSQKALPSSSLFSVNKGENRARV